MELGHAVGAWPLVGHDGHKVAVQLAALEGRDDFFLAGEDPGWRLDHPMLGLDGRRLHHCAPQVAGEDLESTVGAEWLGDRAQHAGILARRR